MLSRVGRSDRIPGIYIAGEGAPVLLVDPEGSASARKQEAARPYLESGRPVLLIDAFQTGAATAPRDRSKGFFLTFNLNDDTNRVQDVATAIAFLAEKHKGTVEVAGLGDAALWCLFGAAVAEVPVRVVTNPANFTGTDQEFIHRFFVPGAQRVGGIGTARRLTGGQP
ncbi:MAG: hypothetical protein NTY38_18265 [Acidobacteria bacterium]|nr:hypothetical protein [Acidobacteriota bacterium]